ncbi:hypothetical protein A6X21_08225 [Planctopirus hydrillae]|uniref:Uncharacterized protein n=1 Tax=Planctopirus hydrillae TaxID=1841610 RepID=A0A1C3E8R8_9PLAN|nr:hypothetical protein A6X21_08225 [Planctopirus hydrillae]
MRLKSFDWHGIYELDKIPEAGLHFLLESWPVSIAALETHRFPPSVTALILPTRFSARGPLDERR